MEKQLTLAAAADHGAGFEPCRRALRALTTTLGLRLAARDPGEAAPGEEALLFAPQDEGDADPASIRAAAHSAVAAVTPRETAVPGSPAEGTTNRVITDVLGLGLGPRSVHKPQKHLFGKKPGVETRAAAATPASGPIGTVLPACSCQSRSRSRIVNPTGAIVNDSRSRAGCPSGVSTDSISKRDSSVATATLISSSAR